MSDQDKLMRVIADLERLRRADAAVDGHPNWLKARRLAIIAECCKDRQPLIEVMNTDPPCVLVGQVTVSESAISQFLSGEERARWQGAGRDGEGFAWLSTFERMAGTHLRYGVWCRHRRWYFSAALAPKVVAGEAIWVPLDAVLTKRGRHVLPLPDKPDHIL